MNSHTLIRQFIALLAASVIVFTLIYVIMLWRNQSPERVVAMASGHVVYQSPDFSLGVTPVNHGQSQRVTLLRYSPEGGWVAAGTGHWLSNPSVKRWSKVLILPDESNGPAGAMWFAAVRINPHLSAIQLLNPGHPNLTQTFSFHGGGIIEPAIINPSTVIRGFSGTRVVFRICWPGH